MIRLFNRDIVCREAVALMTDYLEDALAPRRRRALERHLAACPDCSRYLEQIRLTIVLVGRVQPADLPEPAMDELLEVFRHYREDEPEDPFSPPDGEPR